MSAAPKILLIGGMDSSGGAGLMRDAAAVADLGGVARCAVTAVTAQTDRGLSWQMAVPREGLRAQIAAAFEDGIDAIKIGMLGDGPRVEAVAAALPPAGAVPVVLDPVLRASSGRALLGPAGVAAMLALLLPRADLVTPNLPELAALGAALGLGDRPDPAQSVAALLARGVGAVLVKGGHDPAAHEEAVDTLYLASGARISFAAKRFAFDLRGTGCHLASAIAVGLACGAEQMDKMQVGDGRTGAGSIADARLIAAVQTAKTALGRRFAQQDAAIL